MLTPDSLGRATGATHWFLKGIFMRLPLNSDYISAKEAASMLGVSVETLRFWRFQGKYKDMLAPYLHISRRVFYKKVDVERFSEMSMTAI
ncbi:Helix-turn-helix domain protein [compost metagenome]